jgi:signal transduction histidine kinase
VATAATWLPIAVLSSLAGRLPPGTLERAEFLATTDAEIPVGASGWQSVDLPDDWRRRHPGVREGWYRLRFSAAGDERASWAVYLPAVIMNVAGYVNGVFVGDGGRFEEPVARNWNRPLLLRFSMEDLRAGQNELYLRVVADLPDAGYLPAVSVGRLHDLAPAYDRAWFIRRTLFSVLVALRFVVAAFTAAVWAMRRKEAYYGWFAFCGFAWIGADLNGWVVEIPVSTAAWYWIFSVAVGWWGIAAVRLVLSFIGVSKPGAERALALYGVVGSLALAVFALADPRHFFAFGVNLWLAATFVSSCYLFRGVLPLVRDYPDDVEFGVVFVVALSVVGCVLFDLLMQLGLRPRGGIPAPTYASLAAVSGMGWVLVRRFVGALTESRALVANLETNVREKHAALERSYEQVRAADRARVLAVERERILRDTDEGLGAQLVATLAILERGDAASTEVRESLRAALDDLRLVIDSLDPLDGELVPAVAMLRARMSERLEAAGIVVDWDVDDLPPIEDLTPHRVLQILRVVHDAFVRAASRGSRRLGVRIALAGDGTAASTEIEIQDDGEGSSVANGHVQARMNVRAADAGASLEIRPLARGSVVRLSIPIRRAEHDERRAGSG